MYTVEVYKQDKRTKKGERLVKKVDHSTADRAALEHVYKHTYFPSHGYRFEIHQTMVTRTNAMTGLGYQERYDTPRSCSPSSELYWTI
jgi:hypothetical protein